MAKKQFEVTIEQVDPKTYTIEASNKNAATNKAIRQYREENKNPEVREVIRVGAKAGEVDEAENEGGEEQAA